VILHLSNYKSKFRRNNLYRVYLGIIKITLERVYLIPTGFFKKSSELEIYLHCYNVILPTVLFCLQISFQARFQVSEEKLLLFAKYYNATVIISEMDGDSSMQIESRVIKNIKIAYTIISQGLYYTMQGYTFKKL